MTAFFRAFRVAATVTASVLLALITMIGAASASTDDTSEPDTDSDNVLDADDNCMYEYNPDQSDLDDDGIGDPCDSVDDRTIASPTTVPSVASTTVPATTVPATTVPSTTVPATTVPSTTVPAASTPTEVTVPTSTTTAAPTTTTPAVVPQTNVGQTVTTQVAGAQELAVTGVDEGPALAAAAALVAAGLGFIGVARRRGDLDI